MNLKILLISIISFSGVIALAGYLTFADIVPTPKITKHSVRRDSTGHHYYHGGYRHGK